MDTNEYVIKTKVCRSLSKQFGLEEVTIDETTLIKPPKQHGLENSDVIFPSYYEIHKHPSKIFNLDYFEIIKDDIEIIEN